jgi:hypothetical protein
MVSATMGSGFTSLPRAGTGIDHERFEVIQVQCDALAAIDHMQGGLLLGLRVTCWCFAGHALGAALTVQHVSAGHFVVAAAHQAQFDLVLHIFDVEGAAAWA